MFNLNNEVDVYFEAIDIGFSNGNNPEKIAGRIIDIENNIYTVFLPSLDRSTKCKPYVNSKDGKEYLWFNRDL